MYDISFNSCLCKAAGGGEEEEEEEEVEVE